MRTRNISVAVGALLVAMGGPLQGGDMDGDGKADLAVYHPESGLWFIWQSQSQSPRQVHWGWRAAMPPGVPYALLRWFGRAF